MTASSCKMRLWTEACLLLVFVALSSSLSAESKPSATEPFKVIRLVPTSLEQVNFLGQLRNHASAMRINFWHGPGRIGSPVDIMIPLSRMQYIDEMLDSQGFSYEITIHDVQSLIEKKETKDPNGRLFFDDASEATAYDFRRYHSFDEMKEYLNALQTAYPDMVQLLTLGKTHEDRPMLAAKISSPGQQERRKPGIWIDGGMHAREWASPHTAMFFVNQLVKKYDSDESIKSLLDNLHFYVMPMANPDGYEYSRSSSAPLIRLWRKNRSPETCIETNAGGIKGRQQCCKGVDLNRNFDFHWSGEGSSNDPCEEVYGGKRAFSEPESQAIRDFILGKKDQIRAFITLHTYSQIWMHPFGHARGNYPSDVSELNATAHEAVKALQDLYGTKYIVGTGADTLYPAAGGSDDWAKGKAGIKHVYLIELRPEEYQYDGFILDESQLLPTARETWEGIKIVAKTVLKERKFFGRMTTAAAGTGGTGRTLIQG